MRRISHGLGTFFKGTGRRRRHAPVVVGAALSALAAGLLVAPAPVAQALDANQQPRFERSIGGQGRPGVFAWGVQYNPVTQEVLVGDYLNFRVRRYDKQGNPLGDFWRPDHTGQPYSIAVDPRDGAIYVAELKDNPLTASIAKYDKFGNYLYDADASLSSGTGNRFRAFYPVWMTVEEDTGDLYVLDSHYQNIGAVSGGLDEENPPRMLGLRFDDSTQTVEELAAWTIEPPGATGTNKARIYGVDITDSTGPGGAGDDEFFMTDAWNRRAYVYGKDGTYRRTFAQTQTGGDNRGVSVVEDAPDGGRVYIVDAEHSDVDTFRLDGSYVDSFGSEGGGPGEFAGGGRQIDVDDDGNLWVGDFGGFETEKFTSTGTPLLRAPNPSQRPPTGFFAQVRDVAVDDATGEVWAADAWGQRFQRFSASGAFLGAWGERGPGGPFDMNYPRHIAVQPPTATTPKRIWVVNERGHHLQVYNAPTTTGGSPTYVRQVGTIGGDDTDNGNFRWPGDVEFGTRSDGTPIAVITDRMAASIKVLNAVTFEEIDMTPGDGDPDANFIPFSAGGTAIDPATGNIWAGGGSSIRVYDQAGTRIATYGGSGTSPGQFRDIQDLVLCNGQVYVSDERAAKISALNLDGTFVTRWGTTFGSNPFDFKGPAGLDCDAQGRLYVADSGNDRIQVFNTGVGRVYEQVAPTRPVIQSPAQGAVLPLNGVTLTGTASDNTGVGQVEVSIQNYDTGKWWDSSDASWETTRTASLAAWTSTASPATNVSWRFVFPSVSRQGRYIAEVRTRDHNGAVSQATVRTFAMTGATAPPLPGTPVDDTTRPDATLTSPARNAVLPFAPIQFSGQATDNVGVTSVRIALRRNSDNRWWSGSGTSGFSSGYVMHEAVLATPGGTSTGWTWDWTPRAAGLYTIVVEARDAAGNIDGTKPNVPFEVTSTPPDSTAPETVVVSPDEGATVATGTPITGTATDDTSVTGVRLTVRNAAGEYWTGSGWSPTATTVNAAVATPGASVEWAYSFGAGAGSYTVEAAALDSSGNADASAATRSFVYEGTPPPPDTTAPTPTVTSPSQLNATVPMPSVTIGGAVTDDVGTVSVRISIQDTVTKQWWTGTGWGAFTSVVTVLAEPGARSSTWSYDFGPPAAGRYGYQVTAVDAAGNVSAKTAWRTVTLQ